MRTFAYDGKGIKFLLFWWVRTNLMTPYASKWIHTHRGAGTIVGQGGRSLEKGKSAYYDVRILAYG